MTKARVVALIVIGAFAASSCTATRSGTFKGTPADIYSAIPSATAVKVLLGDANWWAGPPSFEVSPLNSATAPLNERFSVSQEFLRLGTAEELLVRYTVFDTASFATTAMTAYQTAYGTSPSTPKVGDQVLYYGLQSSGAAPFASRTFVRVGQIVVQLVWSRKDSIPTLQQLANNAAKFANGLKNLGKTNQSTQPLDPKLLPPPGRFITLLGSTELPVESFVVMSLFPLPDATVALFHQRGVDTFAYGDYALDNDTRMEVQTALFTFGSTADAADWSNTFSPDTPDANGIASRYVPAGGNPAAGVYHYEFAVGPYGAYMLCKSSVSGEAASRECEASMETTALAWKIALGGLTP